MSEEVQEIRARGYWQTILRPRTRNEARLKIGSNPQNAFCAIRDLSVQMRGWDFPHTNPNDQLLIEQDSIGQDISWHEKQEAWRWFNSGQFFHIAGFRHDWGEPPVGGMLERIPEGTKVLGFIDTLFHFTEMTAFAGNYARSIMEGETLDVLVEVGGLESRRLIMGERSALGLRQEYVATSKKPFKWARELDGSQSEADLRKLARDVTLELFNMFGMTAADAVLEDWQRKMANF